jgi:hypothetical protein
VLDHGVVVTEFVEQGLYLLGGAAKGLALHVDLKVLGEYNLIYLF